MCHQQKEQRSPSCHLDENAFPDAGVFEGTLSNMEGGGDQAIIDSWQLRLAEEDDDDYRWRMESPPDDVIAAVTRLDERREKTAELSTLCEDDHTQHECVAGALCAAPPGTDVSASAHRCLDCQGKIHCVWWCGENWGEYI